MKEGKDVDSASRSPYVRCDMVQQHTTTREVLQPISSLEQTFEDENQDEDGLLAYELLLEGIDLRPAGEDVRTISSAAVTVDDICKLYCFSQPSSLPPMERWIGMAIEDECFPLLAKRSMQDSNLDAARLPSIFEDMDPVCSFGNIAAKANVVRVQEEPARDPAAEGASTSQYAGEVQQNRTPPIGYYGPSTTRSSKINGMAGESSRRRRQKRQNSHQIFLLASPD